MPLELVEFRPSFMGVSREPRLRADFKTRFGVRIFASPDSNFIQSQKHWMVCEQSCNFRVSRRVTRHVPNRADVRVGLFCT